VNAAAVGARPVAPNCMPLYETGGLMRQFLKRQAKKVISQFTLQAEKVLFQPEMVHILGGTHIASLDVRRLPSSVRVEARRSPKANARASNEH